MGGQTHAKARASSLHVTAVNAACIALLFSALSPGICLPGASAATTPTSANCTERFFTQTLDHFNWLAAGPGGETTFQQRYFVCDQFWQPGRRTDLLLFRQ